MSMGRLLLVRHAPTDANRASIYAGRVDDDLAVDATDFVERTTDYLSGVGVARIVSSPQRRAILSARGLSTMLGLELEIEHALAEMEMGPWTGRTGAEIALQFPREWNLWREDPRRVAFGQFEGLAAVERRVTGWLQTLSMTVEGNIACFTHETVIKVLLSWSLGAGSRCYRSLIVPNCGVSSLVWDGSGWRVFSVNEFAPILK
ncbi:histidine phosphatase family protein [Catellatospora tritici]|uniref:histidine phosphatase family protein n=1 Tax=Catellatospora tritici TaxID=2851566 RepID=UPI001C2D9FD1|nr:histidine phosphatase family protein [Catellatospora tritici]MBV1856566.1 histidine phosphatase family protein [Catellatospora tritici]